MNPVEEMLARAPYLRLDEELAVELLVRALREEVEKAGFQKVILGLSGGIDSALALFLSARAFGPETLWWPSACRTGRAVPPV